MHGSGEELRQLSKGAPEAVKRYIQYWRGILTRGEFLHTFFGTIDEGNVARLVQILGPDDLEEIKKLLARGSELRDDWPLFAGTIAFGYAKWAGETEAESEARIARERQDFWSRHWQGVEALAKYFRSIDPTFPG